MSHGELQDVNNEFVVRECAEIEALTQFSLENRHQMDFHREKQYSTQEAKIVLENYR